MANVEISCGLISLFYINFLLPFMEGQVAALGKAFNLEEVLVKNLVKSEGVRKNFEEAVKASGLKEAEKKVGNMLYSVATKMPVIIEKYRERVAAEVGKGDISNPNQLDYIIEYLTKNEKKGGVDLDSYAKDCGIGVKLSEEEIKKIVDENIADADEKSGKFEYLAKIRNIIPYAEGKVLKDTLEAAWKAKGLPDKPVVEKKDKKKEGKKVEANDEQEKEEKQFHIKDISDLIGREMTATLNTKENLNWRKQNFGEGVLTRFPPEPNGHLHIGHCKAMRFNFMQAKVSGGACYLRFDDTNPIKENQEFIDNISENIKWMGYEPFKVTHASDNFDKLYDFAVILIKNGHAFVCDETKDEMKHKRSEGLPSRNRDRPVEESLRLFEEMRLGLHAEGSISLRAKIDYKHANTTLRDPVIYRIRFAPHPHAGNKWCIYPLYDYTHPLCDSLEGISHSLCSLEFEIRRQLYYWVLEKLDIYKPNVWEYSRLNITNTVLSKRTLHALVFGGLVDGWDDPRILTINGMRRRGYPAEAINNFCDAVGVTRRGNENYISFGVLENEVRKYLDVHASRTMAVLDPVSLTIEGLEQNELSFEAPLFPKNEQRGKRKIRLTKQIFVDREDIKVKDEKGFFGIAPNKVVGLKYFSSIWIKDVIVDKETGNILSVIATVDKENRKPNSFLNWISADESFDCTVRTYGLLFNVPKPADHPDFMQILNKDSKHVYKNAKCHVDLLAGEGLKVLDRYQFERKGFFCVDKDSDFANKKIVWNRIVGLQDKSKK